MAIPFYCLVLAPEDAALGRSPASISPRAAPPLFGLWCSCPDAVFGRNTLDLIVDLQASDGRSVAEVQAVPLPAGIRTCVLRDAASNRGKKEAAKRSLAVKNGGVGVSPPPALAHSSDPALLTLNPDSVASFSRLVLSFDLLTAAIYSGSGDISRLFRELGIVGDAYTQLRDELFCSYPEGSVLALVSDSIVNVTGQLAAQSVHLFACHSVEARVQLATRLQHEVNLAHLKSPHHPCPPAHTNTTRSAADAERSPPPSVARLPLMAAPYSSSSEGTHAAPPDVPSRSFTHRSPAPARGETIQPDVNLGKILPKSLLARLRHVRRKPVEFLRAPQAAWVTLVQACRCLDQHLHGVKMQMSGDREVGTPGAAVLLAHEGESGNCSDTSDSSGGGGGGTAVAPARIPPAGSGAPMKQSVDSFAYVRRHHFVAIAGQYFTTLCDRYTAGAIFDELTAATEPLRLRTFVVHDPHAATGAFPSSGGSGTEAGKGTANSVGAAVIGSVRAPAPSNTGASLSVEAPGSPTDGSDGESHIQMSMVDRYERVLFYEPFERYASALARPLLTPPAAWEALRDALSLDPRELIVKVEEYVEIILSAHAFAAVNPVSFDAWKATRRSDARSRAQSTANSQDTGVGAPGGTHPRAAVLKHHDELPVFAVTRVCDMPLQLPAFRKADLPGASLATASSASRGASIKSPRARGAATLKAAPSAPTLAPTGSRTHGISALTPTPSRIFKAGRPLRKFVQDRDAEIERARRRELYDSDSTFVSDASSSSTGKEGRGGSIRGATGGGGGGRTTRRPRVASIDLVVMPPPLTAETVSLLSDDSDGEHVRAASSASAGVHAQQASDGGGEYSLEDANRDIDKLFESRADALMFETTTSQRGSPVRPDSPQAPPLHPHALSGTHTRTRSEADEEGDDDGLGPMPPRGRAPSAQSSSGEGVVTGSGTAEVTRRASFAQTASRLGRGLGSFFRTPDGGGGGADTPQPQPQVAASSATSTSTGAPSEGLVSRFGRKGVSMFRKAAPPPSEGSGAAGAASPGVPASGTGVVTRNALLDAAYGDTGLHVPTIAPLLQEGATDVRVSGTLLITDRNLYFQAGNRNEVLIIPLRTIKGSEFCRTTVKTLGMALGRTSDNGLRFPHCEVRRVVIDPDLDSDAAIATPLNSLFTMATALRGGRTTVHLDRLRTQAEKSAAAAASASASAGGGAGAMGGSRGEQLTPFASIAGSSPMVPSGGTGSNSTTGVPVACSVAATGTVLGADVSDSLSGVVLVCPAVTLIFSKVKDMLLSRGEERSGGRRLVVKQAIDELVASHAVGGGFESVVQELVAVHRQRLAAAHAASTASPLSLWQWVRGVQPSQAEARPVGGVADAATTVPFESSPWLLHAASGGVSFANFSSLPKSAQVWKQHLTRDRRDEVAFPRRLHLYSAVNVIRTRALLKATGRMTESLYLCHNYYSGSDVNASLSVRKFMLQDDPRWMLRLAAWMCHDKDVRKRRAEQLKTFDRRRFKYEFDIMLDSFFYPLNTARHLCLYIYAWETPLLSFVVYTWLLLVAWHDLLPYTFPISLMLHAAAVLTYGALGVELRARIVSFCTRPRSTRGKTLLEKLKNFRNTLANNQVRMNKMNSILLKVRSLYTWRDPDRTRVFVLFMLLLGIIFTTVPAKWLCTAFLLLQLTKPLRSPGAGLFTLALNRFWDGLPVANIADPVYADLADDTLDLVRQLNPGLMPHEVADDIMSKQVATQVGNGVRVQVLR